MKLIASGQGRESSDIIGSLIGLRAKIIQCQCVIPSELKILCLVLWDPSIMFKSYWWAHQISVSALFRWGLIRPLSIMRLRWCLLGLDLGVLVLRIRVWLFGTRVWQLQSIGTNPWLRDFKLLREAFKKGLRLGAHLTQGWNIILQISKFKYITQLFPWYLY